ncbi:type II toxin-antitoxin system RelE/ParE family toxin [Salmonella enterica subsp. enterica serovar Newport]|nr:type II toxin-antitoxin system RelE/ParE family toxin [Salmonella enterica subsp. enterica serovar Newport]EKJ4076127.1 type II toxin-antitoxin system RelE/ParE family toxin [Salmonella enterica subsp. enterica serovar Newport]
MTYKLAFNESALKEWKKLGHTIQEQFKKKLRERLENPRVPASQLHGRKDQYKINLQINIWFIIVLSLKQITSPSLI